MAARTIRAITFGLLATTAMGAPTFAQATDTSQVPPPAAEPAAASQEALPEENDEIIITAQKREENLQNVPISV